MSHHRNSMNYLNYLLTFLTLQSLVSGELNCTYNGFDVVSCSWDIGTSFVSTPCFLNAVHINAKNRRQVKGNCTLPPAVKQRACKLQMTNALNTNDVITVSDKLNITVNCTYDGINVTVSSLENYKLFDNMRLDPPKNLDIKFSGKGLWNLTWVCPPPHYTYDRLEYEVFFKQKSFNSWQNATMIPIRQNDLSVCLRSLLPDTVYEARVRVSQKEHPNGQWSDYSQPVWWETLPEDPKVSSSEIPIEVVVLCSSFLVLLILVPILIRSERIKKIFWVGVPDPSKFFDPLIYTHKGNFQKWLSSPFNFSDFSVDPSPDISPVDINWNKDKFQTKLYPPGLNEIPSDSSGHSMSSFSNQGYFFFQFPTVKEATTSSNSSFSYGCLDERGIPPVLQNVSLPSPVAGEETPLFHADYLSDPMTCPMGIGIQNRIFEVDPMSNVILSSTIKINEEQDVERINNKEEVEESNDTNHQPDVENALPVIPKNMHPSFKEGDMTGGYFSLSTLHQHHYCQWM